MLFEISVTYIILGLEKTSSMINKMMYTKASSYLQNIRYVSIIGILGE